MPDDPTQYVPPWKLPTKGSETQEPLVQQPSTPSRTESSEENTSGRGSGFVVPEEIKGWSWGAFFLNWIWGIGNSVWLALLCFVPFVSLVMPFVLGFKGRKWAWQAKRWDSIEHFKKNQRAWDIAGVVIFWLLFGIGFVWGFIEGWNSAS